MGSKSWTAAVPAIGIPFTKAVSADKAPAEPGGVEKERTAPEDIDFRLGISQIDGLVRYGCHAELERFIGAGRSVTSLR